MEPRAHAAFEKLQKESHLEQPGFKNAKPLLAPKGEYWSTGEDKVLGMFRTKLDAGLTEQEVRARREAYGDNNPPPVAHASALKILLRQLADFIVLILLAGPCVVSCVYGSIFVCRVCRPDFAGRCVRTSSVPSVGSCRVSIYMSFFVGRVCL